MIDNQGYSGSPKESIYNKLYKIFIKFDKIHIFITKSNNGFIDKITHTVCAYIG